MSTPHSTPAPPARPGSRWGFWIVTLAAAATLAGSSAVSYWASQRTAALITRVSGERLVHSVRREIFRSQGEFQTGLESALAAYTEQGLRFAALIGRERHLVASAGTPAKEGTLKVAPRLRGRGPHLEVLAGGERVRVIAPMRPGHGRDRPRRPRRPRFEEDAPPHEVLGPNARLVIEFEPTLAKGVEVRAVTSLIIGLGAAFLLAIAAALIGLYSRRADRLQTQLAHDAQLKRLGQMSAVLGHELKNPLTSLKGHAQLLVEKLGPDHPGRRGAETVVREATRLESLTHQILDFAKTGQLAFDEVSLPELVSSAIASATAEPVEIHDGTAPPTWILDRARFEQVLVNLLQNAREASPPGAPVELSLGSQGDSLVLEVSDRGEGLPPGEETLIFEPFHTTRVKGTGLGLALTRRVVEGHGGRVTAANQPGGGARFRIELPRGVRRPAG